MNDFTVSIIIPIYQVEDYIERCIESVIRQTYDHSKIECILVDDCGPDQSICFAKRCIDKYKGDIHFKIVHNEHNCGQSESRNNGLNIATNSYVYFLDSDDYITSDCIEKLMSVIRENPNVEVVMANHIDKRNGKSISTNRIPRTMINNKELMKLFFLAYIPCMVWNVLISRTLIERGHLRFKTGIIHEDNLWSFKLFREVNFFVFISDITLVYEMNPHSTVNNDGQKEYEGRIISLITILNELYHSIDYRYYEGIIIYITTMLLGLIDRMRRNGDDLNLLEQVLSFRNKLIRKTISDCRLVLMCFVLLLYNPFNYLIKFRLFRKVYHRMSCCFLMLSSFFSPLHKP